MEHLSIPSCFYLRDINEFKDKRVRFWCDLLDETWKYCDVIEEFNWEQEIVTHGKEKEEEEDYSWIDELSMFKNL